MSSYDNWKTTPPWDVDPVCEDCGAPESEARKGWRPKQCTGACGIKWRDPDAERESRRDDPPPRDGGDDE